MTNEEKAKAYNEALKWMRELYPGLHGATKEDAEHYFPELRESEDERIRKELIEFIKWSVDRHFMREDFHQAKRPSEWIAYLEKQKEFSEHGYGLYYYHNGGFTLVARPAIEEEKQKEHHIPWYDYQKSKDAGYTIVPNEEYEQLIKQKEQNPAWSEEDEKIVRFYADDYDNNLGNMPMREVIENRIKFKDWLVNRLKSLRPQPHWKPSEEQIDAVRYFVNKHQSEAWAATGQWKQFTALRGLLGDLLKLM